MKFQHLLNITIDLGKGRLECSFFYIFKQKYFGMKKAIFTSLFLVVVLTGQSQWISIDTITFWPKQCIVGYRSLNPVIISSDTIFIHNSEEKCTPSSYSGSMIYRTTNSCMDYEVIGSFESSTGDTILRKECPNGHSCFMLRMNMNAWYRLEKWTSSQGWSDYNTP